MGGFLIYFAILLIVPIWAQMRVKSTYKKYSKVSNSTGKTGAEVAREILDQNGLYSVQVEPVRGMLSDHYDPRSKVVRLSEDNYYGSSIAGAAVAAHEVGHAIQDAEGYAFLRFRHALVPVANIGSNFSFLLILGGMLLSSMNMFLLGIIFMSVAVLFQFVTLPVEFNASSRAMDQIVSTGLIRNNEERGARKVLNAAALTYVAGALVALLELARFIFMFLGMNQDD
ncbi:MAG: zinc metallopeptidase [Bacillota bacterium]|uniref:Zn-dependent membrane protease YugP n=2 Tax=Fictibacillus TaxID=1329200 RepID=A0ABV2LHG1_9BACL|nr:MULTISPECIES: zinc metallopeptidase [Bacillaceae]MBD7964724.1 zinc metallopeptidase [Fictibacillus norfolkensis]MBH0157442.1 zinc metallopeptidase [Fictibacillus sp. 5RED26]MBH0160326.1 zinc metallopeptidase [Fictibacillus sp. 26RED30]MBH0166617.1 zinc metallopeptidase [Fictibacillus sp. 7GRE50]MBH0168392.1 zinc metallopeptidase [Fictibacillus sp. 18YEL24]